LNSSNSTDGKENAFAYYNKIANSFNSIYELNDWVLSILNADDFTADSYLNF